MRVDSGVLVLLEIIWQAIMLPYVEERLNMILFKDWPALSIIQE